MLNPYIAGAPVVEASMFFGREDVFNWIERSLAGKYVDHILVLHGQRRVGKTSVLKQIPNFLPDKYIQVFFDLQGRTGTTLDRFLWWLASEIVRTLRRDHDINIPKPDRKAFEDTEYLINEFLPGIRPALGDYVLLLTFDEFDSLDRPEILEKLSRPLIAYLRRLIEVEGLNFIFSIGSSGDKLENMQASYTDFFKSALYRKISFLTSDDIQRLVTKPVEGLIKYEKKAVRRIGEITSGHPYFTQLMCHELFSRCQKSGARAISVEDVEAVLEDVVERGTVNLKFVWDEASDLEKWILAALAQMDGGNNQKLAQALTKQRVRFSDSDLNSAIIHLRDKDVITGDNRFVNHLMSLWLVANRPTDRVREELAEVNPIANRYIEIGDEYRDRSQTKQAIESYQQALNVDSGNLKAQANIASVFLDQKDYEQAASAFELALKIDDEDVVSKTGYCDANLALGDAARKRGENEQALALYQKILVINAAHTDARQRSAAIYREQAERQLDAGREDEALRSFSRAMDFTPEDDGLSARYNEILAQKKAKAVAEWLGKAEKALSRQRWDEAAGMVEEALKVDLENQDLAARLVEVKDAPRQFKLQGYRREAETAIARGNWEKAFSALETAIQLAPEDKTLREQLEAVRSDQLNVQLDLHRRGAEKAIAAGDWEAAIAARQAALKLAPGNPDLERALEETRQAQHQAQLDRFQKQVDEAVAAGNWDEAIRAVQAAIKFAPENPAWKNKLTEMKTARHQAQLNAVHAQAESARKAQNWDEALTALENYRNLDPDDKKVQAEIEAWRTERRESELKAFKAQAERAAKAENWDEAVSAWESYLALEPEDGAGVETKLQHARKYAKITGDYAQAQEAMRKKRYGKAIELLQGIIAQEPTYKSTSRLLVEAVEANKATPFWRRPWLLPVAGVLVIAALGVFFGPKVWSAISTSQATSTEKPISSDVVAPVATPVSTLDPEIQLALETIQNESPDFQTGFDSWEFGDPVENAGVEDGKLIIAAENRNGTGVAINKFSSEHFAVEFEFRNLESDSESSCQFDTGNDQEAGSESWRGLSAQFNEERALLARFSYPDYEDFVWETYMGSSVNTVTLLILGDRITAFVNGELIYTVLNPDGSNVFSYHALSVYSAHERYACEFDNYKFWDLTSSGQRAWVAIQNQEPTYQTSFDSWDFGEPVENANLENGKLVVSNDSNINTFVSLNQFNFSSDRFAIEFEEQLLGSRPDATCSLNVETSSKGKYFRIISWPNGHIQVDQPNPIPNNDLVIGTGNFDPSKSNIITLIVLNDQFSLFINGELAFTDLDPEGSSAYTSGAFETSSLITCEFDNYMFWDLRNVDLSARGSTLSPEMQTALDFIETQPTAYENNFDTLDFENSTGNAGVENGKLVISAESDVEASIQFPSPGFNSDSFAVQFDFKLSDSGTQVCGFGTSNIGENEANKALTAGFNPDGAMNLQHYVHPDIFEDLYVGEGKFDVSQFNTFTLIVMGDEIVGIMNGGIVYTAQNPDGNVVFIEQSLWAGGGDCEFDSYKIWDLSETESQTAFYTPIQAYMAENTPTFEDDFSTQKWQWGVIISDSRGNLVSTTTKDNVLMRPFHWTVTRGQTLPSSTNILDSENFSISVDWSLGTGTYLDFLFRSSPDKDAYYKFRYSRGGNWTLAHNNGVSGGNMLLESGKFQPVVGSEEEWDTNPAGDKWVSTPLNNFMFIAQDENLVIFVNGDRILEFTDLGSYGNGNFFQGDATYIDNFKFWNLDGMDFSATTTAPTPQPAVAFYEPIQTYMAQNNPSFEDDFSTQKWQWGQDFVNNKLISENTTDNVLKISVREIHIPSNTNILDSDNFAISVDYSLADISNHFNFMFRSSPDKTAYYRFRYSRGGTWTLAHNNGISGGNILLRTGIFQPVAGSEEEWETNSTGDKWVSTPINNFVFIAQDENLVIFVNGEQILEFNELGSYGNKNYLIGGRYMDNFKFWDLSGVELNQ